MKLWAIFKDHKSDLSFVAVKSHQGHFLEEDMELFVERLQFSIADLKKCDIRLHIDKNDGATLEDIGFDFDSFKKSL